MAFIRTKIKNGRKYRYLVESYWDKDKKRSQQRVIQYLGVEIKDKGKDKLISPCHKMEHIEKAIPIGKFAMYYSAIEYIGLQKILEKHSSSQSYPILALVLNQLCNRFSLEKAANWINNMPLAEWGAYKPQTMNRIDLDNALGSLCFIENGIKFNVSQAIQHEVAKECQKIDPKKRDHLFYDVTKITYYGNKCGYSEKGYNPSHRGKWTIGVGLVISRDNGFPVRCNVIPGSKKDTITMEDMLEALENWGYKGISIIIDRGMMSERNIRKAQSKGFHIIGCCPDTSNDVTNALSFWNEKEICKWENVIKRSSDGMVYVKGRKGKLYGQTGLLVTVVDPARKAMEKANRDIMINEIKGTNDKKQITELKRSLSSVIIKQRGRKGFKIDDNLLQQEEKTDGRFLLFCTDQRINAKNVYNIYFQRDEIEKAFRSLKGEISLGPIRYQRPERIDAYITIVYLAYLLRSITKFRLKQSGVDKSIDQVVDELKNITLVEYSYKDKIRRKVSRVTQKQLSIMKSLKIDKLLPNA